MSSDVTKFSDRAVVMQDNGGGGLVEKSYGCM